jgi:FkbM family methyltransferase
MMSRQFCLSRINFLDNSFLSTSFIDPWGEDDPITAQAREGVFDEEESLNYWACFVSGAAHDSIVLDIGSYVGLFSFVAAAIRPDIKAVAFEASTVTFGRLLENIRWNNFDLRVVPANLAASDQKGFVTFPHSYGILSMSPGESIRDDEKFDHTQVAASVPLDAMLNEQHDLPDYLNSTGIPFGPLKNIAAIKIDVEGHELSVLKGARTLITRFRPPIICESLSDEASLNLHHFFDAIGYRSVIIQGERNIVFIANESYEEVVNLYNNWQAKNGAKLKVSGYILFAHSV